MTTSDPTPGLYLLDYDSGEPMTAHEVIEVDTRGKTTVLNNQIPYSVEPARLTPLVVASSIPTPGDHDELLAEADNWMPILGTVFPVIGEQRLILALATALRSEQNARQALQQRIDAARTILTWQPDHDGDDSGRVEQDYMYRAQLADEAYAALTESKEPDGHICFSGCRCNGQGRADYGIEAPHE